jgi:hypothetical protein
MILKLSTTFILSSSTENVIQVHELLSQAELFKLNFLAHTAKVIYASLYLSPNQATPIQLICTTKTAPIHKLVMASSKHEELVFVHQQIGSERYTRQPTC